MNFAKYLFLVLNCFETSSFPYYEFDLDGNLLQLVQQVCILMTWALLTTTQDHALMLCLDACIRQ